MSDHALASYASLPKRLTTAFAVATDGLMIFSDAGPGVMVGKARKVEESMLDRGAVTILTKMSTTRAIRRA